jgi:hypothetical protein
VRRLARILVSVTTTLSLWSAIGQIGGFSCMAQEELIERAPPPAVDNLEVDENKDGVPDGWYNARDAQWMEEGGAPGMGPHYVRFQCTKPGRPARLSRAFGIDGSKTEAILLGIWVRQSAIQLGEREGSEPSLLIDFLGDQLRQTSRGTMGPWTHTVRDQWTRVVKRIAVPPGTKDAILSIGLMGATGTLDVDGLTVELIPTGGTETVNLVVNGDFELGDPAPASWVVDRDVRRVSPGNQSSAAVELTRAKSRLQAGLAIPIEAFDAVDVSVAVRCAGLRGGGGAGASLFFFDESGRLLPLLDRGAFCFSWSGTNPWRVDETRVRVPPGAVRAVLQFEKVDGVGAIRIDDVRVTAANNPDAGAWAPYHVADDTETWLPVPPSSSIVADSALDVSFLNKAPAEKRGRVTIKDGRFVYSDGSRARFFGVSLLAPAAFVEPEQADQLALRLARSGINLVRLADLDTALGSDRSLFDDTRDDTKEFDPVALERLDHLIAALKARGIYVAVELLSKRRFRVDDRVTDSGLLPAGGGPAAHFDPTIVKLAFAAARDLLSHKNPETGLALRDDPVLAWVTLAGEVSMFDQIDNPAALPPAYAKALRELAEKSTGSAGRRFWEALESAHSKRVADALRKDNLKAPIAGVSHWRRETEFCAAQAANGLDLIDDRLYWMPPNWTQPEMRSLIWSPADGGLGASANLKRRTDRPYVLGQWCNQAFGAWAYPHESADFLLGVYTALVGDWDGIVRRGIFVYPMTWGEGPAGTAGGEDIYQVAEVVNASPHIYALWPHAASLLIRGRQVKAEHERQVAEAASRAAARGRRRLASGWDSGRGRLLVDTPYTQGIAGWFASEPVSFAALDFLTENPFAVLFASSISDEPIVTTNRLLVSALARVEPTGFRWVDSWKRDVADPGRPPFLQEPVSASVIWAKKGNVRGYILDNTGKRTGRAPLERLPGGDGYRLRIDGKTAAFHYELIAE